MIKKKKRVAKGGGVVGGGRGGGVAVRSGRYVDVLAHKTHGGRKSIRVCALLRAAVRWSGSHDTYTVCCFVSVYVCEEGKR